MEKPLLAILGATASGKSTLALSVAQRVGGEIVNCDSMQMIRYLDIGTAKPTLSDREVVPHHLYDTVEPDGFYSAGLYMRDARTVCREVSQRGNIPILVGGTGLYLRVFLEGIFDGPERSKKIRSRLKEIVASEGKASLHDMLKQIDPDAAARIEPGDRIRLNRALEVALLTGQPISKLQSKRIPLKGFSVVKVGICVPRQDLYDRINRRVERMFQAGLLEEVESVLEMGYSPSAKGFEAIGYRCAIEILRHELTLGQAIELTQRDTRRYAKRQLTWFRKEMGVIWVSGPGEKVSAAEEVVDLLRGTGG